MNHASLGAVLLVGILGCNPRGGTSTSSASAAVPESVTSKASSPVGSVSSGAPWAAIPALDAGRAPAKPVAFPSGSKDKRFVVFAASWCGACVASELGDAELARRYAGRIEVAVALQEENASFVASPMSRWLSDVRVYDQDSTTALAKSCHVRGIPAACLLDGDQPLWTGGPGDGAAVIDALLAGKLDELLAKQKDAGAIWRSAVEHPEKRPDALAALHGFAGRENEVAWDLVDKKTPTEAELALGVDLARDAVESTGALDYAILDTYALGLLKSGNDAEAARVGKRVIAVCDATKGECEEERARATKLIARAP